MMRDPKVFIIILNWNGLSDTVQCLESIQHLNYENYEIIVVDNGSTDNSSDVIAKTYTRVLLINNSQNLGFAGGNNIGLRYAFQNGADYCWLLNNDTIVDPYALQNLVNVAEVRQDIGLVGSKIYSWGRDGIIWFAGANIDWKTGNSNHTGMGEKDTGQYDSIRDVHRLTGCSMLVKRAVYEKVGLMDESYFLYVEELDWCVRARMNGFRCIFAPLSVVYHKISASTKENWSAIFLYYNTRNMLQTVRKNFPFPQRWVYILTILSSKIFSIRKELMKFIIFEFTKAQKYSYNLSTLRGIIDFFLGRMGYVSAEEILTFSKSATSR